MTTSSPCALGVAVVSYNTRDLLAACLQSLMTDGDHEVTVVDNGSTDGTLELVRERFPMVRLEVDGTNRGYGAAANRAVALSRCSAVLVLNSDTVVQPGSLELLAGYLSAHPAVGMVGPRLVNQDGSLQPSCFPFPGTVDALVSETGLHRLLRRGPGLRRLSLRTWSHDRARRVPWVSGAALAIRKSAFETVGGFDEQIFMYGEEVDLARRLAAAGYETHFTPVATIMHIRGASTHDQLATYSTRVRASLRFLDRYAPSRSQVGFRAVIRSTVAARMVRDRLHLALASDQNAASLTVRIGTWRAVAEDARRCGR
jgi:N-acetylglucosaminyl-diphospho-decaprenol L-rhamnosyltransferase